MLANLSVRMVALVFVSILSCAWSASAQTTKDYEETIKRAVAEYESSSWLEARVLFRRAHEINPNARTWRGLGLTAFELRRYVDAIAEMEAALADPRKPLTEKQRDELQGLLARAREFVSVYRVTVTPDDAEVLVDGKPATLKDGQLFLDPGDHAVVVRAAGYEERRADLKAGGGEREQLSIALAVAQPVESETAEPSKPAEEVDPAPPAAVGRRRIWTWVLAGSAVAAAGAGAGLRLAAKSKNDDFQDSCQGATPPQRCDGLKSSGESQVLLSSVGFGLSGALFAGAITAFFLEAGPEKQAPSATAVLLGPSSIALRGAF